tara:strand:+ start:1439 stop:2029 length:591 start_codon:yes stop_codon:yes gene_type:complete
MAFLDPSISNEAIRDFSPIPEGVYEFVIDKVEVKPSRTGGELLKLQGKITSPEGSGRLFFDQLNIVNSNAMAQEIGRRTLTQLRILAGIEEGQLSNTDQLLGARGLVSLSIEDGTEGRAPQNKVLWYRQSTQGASGNFISKRPPVSDPLFDAPAPSAFNSAPAPKAAYVPPKLGATSVPPPAANKPLGSPPWVKMK